MILSELIRNWLPNLELSRIMKNICFLKWGTERIPWPPNGWWEEGVGGVGSIPGGGIKIPQTVWYGQKKKKKSSKYITLWEYWLIMWSHYNGKVLLEILKVLKVQVGIKKWLVKPYKIFSLEKNWKLNAKTHKQSKCYYHKQK